MYALKQVVTSLHVLVLPNFQQGFTIKNVSGAGIEALLSQNRRPVAFLSQVFSSQDRIKSMYEKELLAIVKAISKWKHYLTGKYFVIKKDQRSLRHLLDQKAVSTIQQRWSTKLIGLNYWIEYKSRVKNRVVDALARKPHGEDFTQFTLIAPLSLDRTALIEE